MLCHLIQLSLIVFCPSIICIVDQILSRDEWQASSSEHRAEAARNFDEPTTSLTWMSTRSRRVNVLAAALAPSCEPTSIIAWPRY